MPTTWPADEEGHPSVRPVDGTLRYIEGLFIGYRAYDRDNRPVRYPFGHGLGYTEWSYDALDVPDVTGGDAVVARVTVRNTGSRSGRDVVQVYASRPDSAVERPVRWLVGFAPVDLAAGESATVDVPIAARALQHWEPGQGWVTEPGTFRLQVGRSSRDLPLSGELNVAEAG